MGSISSENCAYMELQEDDHAAASPSKKREDLTEEVNLLKGILFVMKEDMNVKNEVCNCFPYGDDIQLT